MVLTAMGQHLGADATGELPWPGAEHSGSCDVATLSLRGGSNCRAVSGESHVLAWLPTAHVGRRWRGGAKGLSSFFDAADNTALQSQAPTATAASQSILLSPTKLAPTATADSQSVMLSPADEKKVTAEITKQIPDASDPNKAKDMMGGLKASMEEEEQKKQALMVHHSNDGPVVTGDPKGMDDLQRANEAARDNVKTTKASLKDLRTQLDKMPTEGNQSVEMSRDQRVQRLQLKKQEQVLVGQERKELEEQLSVTKEIKNRVGVAKVTLPKDAQSDEATKPPEENKESQ